MTSQPYIQQRWFITLPFQCSPPDQRCPERRNGHK
nr:MAG TPA: hypothetical protein [Caudoviricetes sp.]